MQKYDAMGINYIQSKVGYLIANHWNYLRKGFPRLSPVSFSFLFVLSEYCNASDPTKFDIFPDDLRFA